MEDETSNPNLEWKKSGFEDKEHLTRKTDTKKALVYDATRKNSLQPDPAFRTGELPKGLKKIRKKIKEVYDEDDEDENDFIIMPLEQSNSLLNALHEDELRQLKQQETLNTQKMLQDAGKMEALMSADKTTRELGLKGLSKETANQNMQDVSLNSKTYENALKEDIRKRLRLRGRKLSEGETINLLRGIKRISDMAEASEESKLKIMEGMKISEIVNAGEKNTDDKEVAKLILKKSGRKTKKGEKKTPKKPVKKAVKSKSAELFNNPDLYRD